jgi:hypothetical protein
MRRAALALILLATAAPAGEPLRAAYFGADFIDMSLDGDDADERRRIGLVDARLVEALAASGRYAFVDVAPVRAKAARHEALSRCNGCDAPLAAELGAAVSITAAVQKTSNLILHLSVYVRDAATGALVAGGSADIRGNTDESWTRGIDFIIRRRLLGG